MDGLATMEDIGDISLIAYYLVKLLCELHRQMVIRRALKRPQPGSDGGGHGD